jgi:KipI family sensor histidine kinase inhibitor
MWPALQMETLAEDALLLRFGEAIELSINARVHAAAARLQEQLTGVECVPAYASLMLRFDLAQWSEDDALTPQQRLQQAVLAALQDVPDTADNVREVQIPVFYGGEAGPDLAAVAAQTGLSEAEVITRHSAATYRVAMLGFAPGFPYLLGLDPALAVPRRVDPRMRVPAGSVAIGGSQTGIYPQALPGGWQLIGRTPRALFDLDASSPSLLRPGDRVRFRSIDQHESQRLEVTETRR